MVATELSIKGLNRLAAKNKKLITLVVISALVLTTVIGYRIYSNLTANKDRAGRATQGRAVTAEIAPVSRKDIVPVLSFSANLEPLWSAEVSAKVDGRIDRILVEEGDSVKAGAVLAVLDTNELAAQLLQQEGSLLRAQADLEQAELELSRKKALVERGAVSVSDFDLAKNKRDLSVGALRTAEGNMALYKARLDNANVVAPRDGIVVKRFVQAGYYTKTGAPIVSIADTTSLLAKAVIGEAQVQNIALGTNVKVTVGALGNQEFSGVITRISPAAAAPARTFTAEVAIPNSQGVLRSGLFAKVSAPMETRKNVLVVPEGALVMKEDQKTVFRVSPQGQAQQVTLTLGYVGNGFAEVLEGIKDGELIVVAGHNKVKDGAMIQGAGTKEGGRP